MNEIIQIPFRICLCVLCHGNFNFRFAAKKIAIMILIELKLTKNIFNDRKCFSFHSPNIKFDTIIKTVSIEYHSFSINLPFYCSSRTAQVVFKLCDKYSTI